MIVEPIFTFWILSYLRDHSVSSHVTLSSAVHRLQKKIQDTSITTQLMNIKI